MSNRLEVHTEIATNGDVNMPYLRFGEGEKVFVILPGLSLKLLTSVPMAIATAFSKFAERYTVYLFDVRLDPPKGYTLDKLAEDTYDIMRYVGIEKADIFGASLGGMILLDIAINHPQFVGKMILGSSASRLNKTFESVLKKWTSIAREGDVLKLMKVSSRDVYSKATYDMLEKVLPLESESVTSDDLERLVLTIKALEGFDLYKDLDKISSETFVIGSEGDKVTTCDASREIAEKLGCKAYYYDERYGHSVFDEAPDYRDRMLDFLGH